MTDDSKAIKDPVNDTPDTSMPDVEQKTDDTPEPVPAAPSQDEVSVQDTQESELPADVKERTRREFEKLREELRTERDRRKYFEQVFTNLQPKEQPKPQPTPIYDPNTGLLNENVLTDIQRKALEAEERAKKAEAAVQNYFQEKEKEETFKDFPELNPDDSKVFNKDLHVATRRILLDSMMHPEDYGGKELSFKDAAAMAKKVMPKAVEQAKEEGAKQALENLTPKEQAALEATGSPNRRFEVGSSMDELRYKTRKGDINAVIERLEGLKPKKANVA